MDNYTPDRWVILKFEQTTEQQSRSVYKILAGWYGSYLGASSWRLNSGIVDVTETEDCYLFHGDSGSVYSCAKSCYGLTSYTSSIYEQWREQFAEDGQVSVMMLTEDDLISTIDLLRKVENEG